MRGVWLGLLSFLCVTAGCEVSPPDEQWNWTLTDTPNAVESSKVSGYIAFAADEDPVAYVYEVVSFQPDTEPYPLDSLLIEWFGSWDVDGDLTIVELECASVEVSNRTAPIDCATASLSLTCHVVGSGTENATLDCGDYRFKL